MLVFGIDPGVNNTGFALVEKSGSRFRVHQFGVIRPEKELKDEEKILHVHEAVSKLCALYHPEEAAVEELFFAKNARSAIAVGQVRGGVLLAFAQHGIPVFGYSPKEIKMALVGTGTALKEQVSRMVALLTGVKEKEHPYDAYDAVAAAICHMNKRPLTRLQ
ncbi:MAG TPA: crossover junction endodeoxyribonuclease RuvC [Candidatus Mcinerneyibacteriales bacterium]|nr:crossover junction endodeoxyribonuclease RuvC [Candidatus Mcinerneyibacteriales bacterium]